MDPSSHRLFHQVDRGSPYKECPHQVIMRFLYENIFIRFGCPVRLVTDNTLAFKSMALVNMCESMGIHLVHSTSYYPQGNGLAESSNKSLVKIIRKLLENNQKSWDSKLKFALWDDRVIDKRSIKKFLSSWFMVLMPFFPFS